MYFPSNRSYNAGHASVSCSKPPSNFLFLPTAVKMSYLICHPLCGQANLSRITLNTSTTWKNTWLSKGSPSYNFNAFASGFCFAALEKKNFVSQLWRKLFCSPKLRDKIWNRTSSFEVRVPLFSLNFERRKNTQMLHWWSIVL